MKAIPIALAAVFVMSANVAAPSVWAADQMSKRDNMEKIDKDIAKDKEDVSSKKADITTAQTKLDQDMNQYGKDSKEVRDDQQSIMKLRNDFVDARATYYKDVNKKKVAEGQPVETEPGTC